MHADQVAKTWVYRALCDLYCAFTLSDDWTLEDQERFLEIMGLEKFLKSVLLFHKRTQYEHLSDAEARVQLNKMARALGHDVDKLLRRLRALNVDVDTLLTSDFDGYQGAGLVKAVKAGYMETRYPVPNLISEQFPIPGAPGVTHDPLSSSGFTKFVTRFPARAFALFHQRSIFRQSSVSSETPISIEENRSFASNTCSWLRIPRQSDR